MRTKSDPVTLRLYLLCQLAGLPCDAWRTMSARDYVAAVRRRALS